MDQHLTPDTAEAVLEDALRTYAASPLPLDLTPAVMARIRTVPAPRPFRLAASDLLLGAALALSFAAVWFSLQHLPPLVIAQIRKESILMYQQFLVHARWLMPAVPFALAGLLAALTIPSLRRELLK